MNYDKTSTNQVNFQILENNAGGIDGLIKFNHKYMPDTRGSFAEIFNKKNFIESGLPDLNIVQINKAHNIKAGTTRGIHFEPWDKVVTADKPIYVAIVNLREGKSFGKVYQTQLNPSESLLVPYGCGNSYQCLFDDTTYIYGVTDHWYQTATKGIKLNDSSLGIIWPISLEKVENSCISQKDLDNPPFADLISIQPRKVIIFGADGQLGQELINKFGNIAIGYNKTSWDISDESRFDRSVHLDANPLLYSAVINAAAYTKVDNAETDKDLNWQVNAKGVQNIVKWAMQNNLQMIHFGTDMIYGGNPNNINGFNENDTPSPLNQYGVAKLAGVQSVLTYKYGTVINTSWVTGSSKNFVPWVIENAQNGKEITIFTDQIGKLTFVETLTSVCMHVLEKRLFGLYNVTNSGDQISRFDLARKIYKLLEKDESLVKPTNYAEWMDSQIKLGKTIANRSLVATLDISKVKETGFEPEDQLNALERYLKDKF